MFLSLDDDSVRVEVGLRLGVSLCSPFQCVCGLPVDSRGSHPLACIKSSGRQQRHAMLNNLILHAFSRAGVPTIREPSGLIPASALRPDGSTVVPWQKGRCLAWDATCPDTLAPSNLAHSTKGPSHMAEYAAQQKVLKYQQLSSHSFVPLVIETLGAFNSDGLLLLNTLGSRLIAKTGDQRERMFLYQRLSVAVQRGNAICFFGSYHQDLFHKIQ